MHHLLHRFIFKVLSNSHLTEVSNCTQTNAGFCMDAKCKVTDQEYDIFILPKKTLMADELIEKGGFYE